VAIAGGALIAEGTDQPTRPSALAKAFAEYRAVPGENPDLCRPALAPCHLNDLLGVDTVSRLPPMSRQLRLLLARAWLSMLRDRRMLGAMLGRSLAIGLVVGLVYKHVFEDPEAPWANLFDLACQVGSPDASPAACLVDIPRHSSLNVTCVLDPTEQRCTGHPLAQIRGPSLEKRQLYAPVCSLAPLLLSRNTSSVASLEDSCSLLEKFVGVAGSCEWHPEHGCVAGHLHLGHEISPAALSASSMFFLAVLYLVMGNLQEVPRLFEARLVFRREMAAGAYQLGPLWLSQILANLPMQCFCFSVFFNLSWWLIHIPMGRHAANYFYCFAMLLTTNGLGFALAQLLAVTAPSADWALSLFTMLFLFLASFSGFTLLVPDIPLGWRWARYTSFVRWAYQGLVTQLFSSMRGGDGVVEYWGFAGTHPMELLAILWGYALALNLLSLLGQREPKSRLVLAADVPQTGQRTGWGWRRSTRLDADAVCQFSDELTSGLLDDRGTTAQERAAQQLAKSHPISVNPGVRSPAVAPGAYAAVLEGPFPLDGAPPELRPGSGRGSRHLDRAEAQSPGVRLAFRDVCFSVSVESQSGVEACLKRSALSLVGEGPLSQYEKLDDDPGPASTRPQQPAARTKPLLGGAARNGINGRAEPGKILAVMGPSGAGKSTLLELLAGRKRPSSGLASGVVMVNGLACPASDVWRLGPDSGLKLDDDTVSSSPASWAYVAQETCLMPLLTVRETLEVAVALRLSTPAQGTSRGERVRLREQRTSLLLDLLGLRLRQHLYVLDSGGSGLSGGEAKRLSVAMELVNLPPLIYLDEPTSGLDSSTAHEVASAIRALADQNRSIVLTVHQPSVTTLAHLDDLLLLADGQCAYFGPLRKAVAYFHQSSLSLRYRPGLNPADFLVAAVSARSPDSLAAHFDASELGQELEAGLRAESPTLARGGLKPPRGLCHSATHPSTFGDQVGTLVRRNGLYALREPRGLFGVVLRHMVVALFFATLYRFNDASDSNPQNVASLLFLSVFFLAVGHQHSIPTLLWQKGLWRHEQGLGLYSTRALYTSQALTKWPVHLVCVFFYALIVYTSCGLRRSPGAFAFFVFVLQIASLVSLSVCELIAYVSPSAPYAMTVFLPVSFYFVAFSGFVVLIPSLPMYMRHFFPQTSYLRWAFQV